jgi:D-alanyl-D-alanine carboxypeptidase (penicillin-binding protein 5/6)
MLDYGFANYAMAVPPAIDDQLTPVKVRGGTQEYIHPVAEVPEGFVVRKGTEKALEQTIELLPEVEAPIVHGQVIGSVLVRAQGKEIDRYDLKAGNDVRKMSFSVAFWRLLGGLCDLSDEDTPETVAYF